MTKTAPRRAVFSFEREGIAQDADTFLMKAGRWRAKS